MSMLYTSSGPGVVNDMNRIPIYILDCKLSKITTLGKMFLFGDFLVRIFSYSD